MEWVETTAKSLDEAKELALDRLGIGPDDAEFEILEEPRSGLFGRTRGEARVRARVKPATVRPKQDRRNRRRPDKADKAETAAPAATAATDATVVVGEALAADDPGASSSDGRRPPRRRGGTAKSAAAENGSTTTTNDVDSDVTSRSETAMSDQSNASEYDDRPASDPVEVAVVQRAAEEFSTGLLNAFGLEGSASSSADGIEIDVRIDGHGDGLGLLIGPGGRTLLAIQDLARVAAQRRLGDHETRLRIDIAGYREKRRAALEKFASHVAELVKESGVARSLDPMPSADRKIIHDTLSAIDGVATRSEGEDPYRRIVVSPG